MKLLKTLGLSLAAASVAATTAFATPSTVLHIVGSTAFRASVTQAILHQLGTTTGTGGGETTNVTFGDDKGTGISGALGCNYSAFLSSDGTTAVECYWTGSLAGVTDLVARPNDPFPSWNQSGADTLSTTGTKFDSSYALDSVPPDVAMSDSYAGSVATILATSKLTGTVGGQTTAAGLANLVNHASVSDGGTGAGSGPGPVGIVVFEWVAGNITNATGGAYNYSGAVAPPFTNITSTVVQNLVAGPTPVSIFPGNTDANASTDFVYLIGRNEDSGTRIDGLSTAGVGLTPSSVNQLALAFTNNQTEMNDNGTYRETGGYSSSFAQIATVASSWGGGTTFTNSHNDVAVTTGLYPADPLNTEPLVTWNLAGHSGYIAGGDVAKVLSAYNNESSVVYPTNAPSENASGKVYYVGYLGLSDASSVAYGTQLLFNGQSPTPAGVANGTYTMWSLEHLYYLGGTNAHKLTGGAKTLADNLADSIYNTYACSDSSGQIAASTALSDEANVKSSGSTAIPGIFDGAGLFLENSLVVPPGDGLPYNLNY